MEEYGWTKTYTGKHIYLLYPDPELICIEDIAHHLSIINRFNGSSLNPYSVAQHSVLASWYCSEPNKPYALLHDASETYLQDITAPLKRSPIFAEYRKVEHHVQGLINAKFGLEQEFPPEIKIVDTRLLATEKRDLVRYSIPEPVSPYPTVIEPWSAAYAEMMFLLEFRKLFSMEKISIFLLTRGRQLTYIELVMKTQHTQFGNFNTPRPAAATGVSG